MKPYLWDYDEKELKKTKSGRIKILERKINYGVYRDSKDKISRSDLMNNWNAVVIEEKRKRFLHYLLWGT